MKEQKKDKGSNQRVRNPLEIHKSTVWPHNENKFLNLILGS